jgi:hypothetical protein
MAVSHSLELPPAGPQRMVAAACSMNEVVITSVATW